MRTTETTKQTLLRQEREKHYNPMRLPEKSEVEKSRLLEQQEEAKVGLKLARQIDSIRLELIKEQNNLSKFKTETTKLVQDEIDVLIQKNKDLKLENDKLEHSNKLLKEPFEKEWKELHERRVNELHENTNRIEKARVAIEQDQAKISLIRSQNEKDKESIARSLQEAYNSNEVAKTARLQAENILESARIVKAEAQSRIDAENNQLDTKTQELALQLRDIQVRESLIEKENNKLSEKEHFIRNKYEDEIKENIKKLEKSLAEEEKEKSQIHQIKLELEDREKELNIKISDAINNLESSKREKEMADEMLRKTKEEATLSKSEIELSNSYISKQYDKLSKENKKFEEMKVDIINSIKELDMQKSSLDSKEKELNKKLSEVTLTEIEVDREKKHTSKLLSDAQKIKSANELIILQTKAEKEKANEMTDKAKEILESSKNKRSAFEEQMKIDTDKLYKKQESVALKLRDVEVREALINKSREELERKNKFINSKYKVLMQTENALKNK